MNTMEKIEKLKKLIFASFKLERKQAKNNSTSFDLNHSYSTYKEIVEIFDIFLQIQLGEIAKANKNLYVIKSQDLAKKLKPMLKIKSIAIRKKIFTETLELIKEHNIPFNILDLFIEAYSSNNEKETEFLEKNHPINEKDRNNLFIKIWKNKICNTSTLSYPKIVDQTRSLMKKCKINKLPYGKENWDLLSIEWAKKPGFTLNTISNFKHIGSDFHLILNDFCELGDKINIDLLNLIEDRLYNEWFHLKKKNTNILDFHKKLDKTTKTIMKNYEKTIMRSKQYAQFLIRLVSMSENKNKAINQLFEYSNDNKNLKGEIILGFFKNRFTEYEMWKYVSEDKKIDVNLPVYEKHEKTNGPTVPLFFLMVKDFIINSKKFKNAELGFSFIESQRPNYFLVDSQNRDITEYLEANIEKIEKMFPGKTDTIIKRFAARTMNLKRTLEFNL